MNRSQNMGHHFSPFDEEEYEYEEDIMEFEETDSPLDDFFAVNPITTAQRLEQWPEMALIKPPSRKKIPEKILEIDESPKSRIPLIHPSSNFEFPKIERKPQTLQKPTSKVQYDPSVCNVCGSWFRTSTALKSHEAHHSLPANEVPVPAFLCPMEGCGIRCDAQTTLNEHVRISHNRNDLIYQTLQFQSIAEFENWKEILEETTTSRFARVSGKYSFTGRTSYFSCFFTARSNKSEGRGIRARYSKKNEKSCTAHFTVKESIGVITVYACLTHCGHEDLNNNLPLSKIVKKEIATALMQGLNDSEIIHSLKQTSPEDRRFYIRPYEIRNILKKMTKSATTDFNVVPSDQVIMDEEKPAARLPELPPFVAQEEEVS